MRFRLAFRFCDKKEAPAAQSFRIGVTILLAPQIGGTGSRPYVVTCSKKALGPRTRSVLVFACERNPSRKSTQLVSYGQNHRKALRSEKPFFWKLQFPSHSPCALARLATLSRGGNIVLRFASPPQRCASYSPRSLYAPKLEAKVTVFQ